MPWFTSKRKSPTGKEAAASFRYVGVCSLFLLLSVKPPLDQLMIPIF